MDQDQYVLFAPRFLEQHAGASILTDPVVALIELVANAWDAGATEVRIDWPDRREQKPFAITDNGHGMSDAEFRRRWMTLSYDRRAEQGTCAHFPDEVTELPSRPAFGRNGIGRHGVFCFGESYVLRSWKGGTEIAYRVSRGERSPLNPVSLGVAARDGHGTSIQAEKPRFPLMTADQARAEIGIRFLTDPAFSVFVDDRQVVLSDVPSKQLSRIDLSIEGVGPVTILVLDTRETDRTAKQHGIAWHVKERLVGNCSWRGSGHERFLDGRRAEAKRYTFLVHADGLEDAVEPDWSGFKQSDERYQRTNERVQSEIRNQLIELTKEKRHATTQAVRAAHRETIVQMTPLSYEKWDTFVNEAQTACPSITEGELTQLAGVLAKLEVAGSAYALIGKLSELDSNDLDELHRILEEWSFDSAKLVLDELQTRMRIVDELRRKIRLSSTQEVQELQPLFHQGLWIFGPEYETIEFTSNQGMTAVIQQLFDSAEKGSLNRPDFVIRPDSTVGFYSYPKYDSQGAEIGIDRLTVVELKRPGISISTDEKAQAWKYIKELIQRGLLQDHTRVTCFVLGSELDSAESMVRTELNGRVEIYPMIYDTVLERASSRLLRLYERVRAAPFLQDKIESYLDGPTRNVSPQGDLLAQEVTSNPLAG